MWKKSAGVSRLKSRRTCLGVGVGLGLGLGLGVGLGVGVGLGIGVRGSGRVLGRGGRTAGMWSRITPTPSLTLRVGARVACGLGLPLPLA